ncbi:DUF4270 family protein [Geofilum rhodophaeum]|uniref:DUF4270 family protein n=1 Tax=Geofilum rhodophaeum TaxID=1965019 RepID=UPI000B529077|nr:DUF4270 family protein [Geofilum rhodophaeum]
MIAIKKWLSLSPFILIIAVSCENTDNGLGNHLVDPQAFSTYIDTCTVKLTTLKSDSIATSGNNILIAGAINEPWWGNLEAHSYLSFTLPVFSEHRQNENTPLVMDSLTFEMHYTGSHAGDSTEALVVSLHTLKKVLTLPSNGSFYSHHHQESDSIPLVSQFLPSYIQQNDSISLRLPDKLGEELLEKLSLHQAEFENQETFNQYFPGLALTMPKNHGNTGIYNFHLNDSSGTINLYYHFVEEFKEQQQITIKPNTSTSYYQIKHNYADTPFAALKSGYNGLAATTTNNEAVTAGLSGFLIRIEFPYLRNILELGKTGYVDYAELILRPVEHSYPTEYPLPETLQLYVVDENNSATNAVTSANGTELQTGDLQTDEEFQTHTQYVFDITDFINTEINAIGINKRALLLSLSDQDLNSMAQRVILGNTRHKTNPVQLIIRYNRYE